MSAILDAFFPFVPSESIVIVAGTLAGAGDLNVFLVILSAWAGAVIGDNISYGIGKFAGERTVRRLFHHPKALKGFDWAEKQLEERGSYIIIIARFIPFGRTAVTFTAGYTKGLPWHRFFRYDLLAGGLWATYATMLGYIGGKQFEEQPWKGVVLGLAIAFSVAFAVEWIRHRRAKASWRPTASTIRSERELDEQDHGRAARQQEHDEHGDRDRAAARRSLRSAPLHGGRRPLNACSICRSTCALDPLAEEIARLLFSTSVLSGGNECCSPSTESWNSRSCWMSFSFASPRSRTLAPSGRSLPISARVVSERGSGRRGPPSRSGPRGRRRARGSPRRRPWARRCAGPSAPARPRPRATAWAASSRWAATAARTASRARPNE